LSAPCRAMSAAEVPNPNPAANDVSHVVEHLFRHESAKMVATLTRIFGVEHMHLAEDVVQEALARAMQTWPFYGVPQNPAAWIMRASRNLALDVVRRQKTFHNKQAELVRLMDNPSRGPDAVAADAQEIADDRLRMMFVCCHPAISQEDQVALSLKTLCGFSPTEIANAFLSTEAAIAKRLTRARQRLREAEVRFEIPEGPDLALRLDSVLQTLYLMFNEGYKASAGSQLVRADVCDEAIRLTSLLVEHSAGDTPASHALLALMHLNAARLASRTDEHGQLLRLQDQDRTRWNREQIARGLLHMARSATGDELSTYHLQSGIAACHCTAPDHASTDWSRILALYDLLLERDRSPVVALNRAVAVAEVHGAQAGLDALNEIPDLDALDEYHLLHAVRGEFEARLNHHDAAAAHFRKALQLAEGKPEQDFLARRLEFCERMAG
jgi:RNA polymerase sigma factor (sigma-70 family)